MAVKIQLIIQNNSSKQRSFIKRQMSNNEWQRVVPRMTTNYNERQRMETSDNEWSFRLIFLSFE